MTIEFVLNGRAAKVESSEDTPLLWVIRDELQYTGTKFGCGKALCGACTIHLDGTAMRSCITPISMAQGKSVTTIEGLNDPIGEALKQAWYEENVVQCGYCQPGQLMTASSLLKTNPTPRRDQIIEAMTGNICRCGTYPRIVKAIERASDALKQNQK